MAENNRNCFFKYIKSQDKAKKKLQQIRHNYPTQLPAIIN